VNRSVVLALASLAALSSGCLYTTYVSQAANGQFELLGKAKPLNEVINDPETPLRTALLLAEIPAIKAYGKSYGLKIRKNYEAYSALGRPAAVWFTAAADPVSFRSRKWCSPIVGCFAGLGLFGEALSGQF